MQTIVLYSKCPQCNGTGEYSTGSGATGSGPMVCEWPGCSSGIIAYGEVAIDPGLDDVIDKCNDILDKCNDILEAMDRGHSN